MITSEDIREAKLEILSVIRLIQKFSKQCVSVKELVYFYFFSELGRLCSVAFHRTETWPEKEGETSLEAREGSSALFCFRFLAVVLKEWL